MLGCLLIVGCGDSAGTDAETDASSSGGSSSSASSATITATGSAPTTDADSSSTTLPSDDSPTTDPGTESSGEAGSSSTGEDVGTPGCTAKDPLADGEHTIMVGELERRYVVRLPQNYSSDGQWPLIFALHGNGGNPGYWDATGGDRDIRTAFADEAILIIPEAVDNQWRNYDADPATWPAGMERELEFFDAVYETVGQQLCIDTDNVFSMGFSGGGSFSGVLGCRRDYIRAIAVGGSVIYFEEEDCTEQPAAWITIGEGELVDGRIAFRDFFVQHAGCADTSMPGSPEGCVDYDTCAAETPVTYCTHPAGHVWPTIGTDATREFFRSFYAQ